MVKDDLANVSVMGSDAYRIQTLLQNILPNDRYAICYVDEKDSYQFARGGMSLDELLALKSMIEIEMYNTCMDSMDD